MLKYITCTSLRTVIIFLTLAKCYESNQLNVLEGDMAQLKFQYPCNSTKVTLQRSNGVPFYSSENPDVILESNKIVSNKKGNDACSLNLMINPVFRNDVGTYIPIAYKNGHMVIPEKETSVWLGVEYPPGKASCELHRGDIPEGLVKLQCQAPKGTLPGQIVCYQNDTIVSSMTSPHENDRTLDQTLLARVIDPVYCCSSILAKTKDRCECNDWGWDPGFEILLSNIDPCAATCTSTAHSSTSSPDPGKDITTATKTSIPPLHVITEKNPHPPQKVDFKMLFVIVAVFFGLSIITLLIVIAGIKIYQSNSERPSKPPQRRY